ncbi:hypothetical protein CKAN_02246000 [Cinnamomum micranthum f. kanehirae]|uniref:DUF3143 domain-containing protein n=1 Tax=Cinnamomum micranthum f. kanehirae TaxID=337451 RepID=A0A3S3NS18_9MAGN|nr:hypothetical protein CKAN_02246000 [Cinnamomum micranthum f. kanehirae]
MPLSISTPKTTLSSSSSLPSPLPSRPSLSLKLPLCPQALRPPHLLLPPPPPSSSRRRTLVLCNSSSSSSSSSEISWLEKLPESNKPLYSHSLPCIEAWLKKLGFHQSRDDRALWSIENPGWHAQLSLDVTDLHIRYLKSGPGNLEKDVERKFSYALSRKDVENAILGGP